MPQACQNMWYPTEPTIEKEEDFYSFNSRAKTLENIKS